MKEIKLFGRQVLSWGDSSKTGRSVKNALADGNRYAVEGLSLEMCRRVALKEPLVLKAIHKKNKDTFRNWFTIKNIDGSKVAPRVENIIRKFEKDSNIKNVFYKGGVCANIYGTGFVEPIYSEKKSIDKPPSNKARPVGLKVINSECINQKEVKDNSDGIIYWIYKNPKTGDQKYIHPERIIDIAIDSLPFSPFGISKIDVLANIMQSKMNADIAAGETLAWFSTGVLDMTIQDMNDDQEKKMLQLFKEHPHYYVHDQDYALDVKNPTRIDPKPFYDYFYTNIAAALEMPTHILVGESKNITGVEVGISDYYHDIENIQKVIFEPIIEKLYGQLLKSYGYKWNYVIEWNPIFVDEQTEGKILQVRSYSAQTCKNSGIISIPEARKILNDGVVDLDVDKVPKQETPQMPQFPGKPSNPNIEPQPAVKKPTVKNIFISPLPDVSKRMIEECARRERELGEKILKEQEEIFKPKEAKSKKNKRGKKK